MNNPAKLFCVFDEYGWIEEKYRSFWLKNPVLERYFVASKYRDYFNHYNRVGIQYQYTLLCRLAESYRKDMMEGRILEDAFLSPVWQRLQEMEDDLNLFFCKSARRLPDERLKECQILNESVYVAALFEKLQTYAKVFLYGAGKVGQGLARKILAEGGRVDGFVVTKLAGQDRMCMGIPVYEIQEITDFVASCAVVIAVTEGAQFELYQNLKQYKFQNIFRMDAVVRQRVMSQT